MLRTAAAGEQPGGRLHKEGATCNAKASQWTVDRCGEGWFPGRKGGRGGAGQGRTDVGWAETA